MNAPDLLVTDLTGVGLVGPPRVEDGTAPQLVILPHVPRHSAPRTRRLLALLARVGAPVVPPIILLAIKLLTLQKSFQESFARAFQLMLSGGTGTRQWPLFSLASPRMTALQGNIY